MSQAESDRGPTNLLDSIEPIVLAVVRDERLHDGRVEMRELVVEDEGLEQLEEDGRALVLSEELVHRLEQAATLWKQAFQKLAISVSWDRL